MNKDSWEILKLVDICLFFNDGNWIESKDQSESGIRLIQTGNIGNGYYINKEARAKFISEDTFKNLKCTEVFEGDCLVSRLPDPIGRACIVPLIKGRAITSVDCSILRFKPNILASYFVYFSQCKKYTLNIKKSSTGSTRKRISRSNLGNILVPIPPLPIQGKIVKELDTLSDIITKKKEQLAELDKLAQATFYDMFGDPVENEKNWKTTLIQNICTINPTKSSVKSLNSNLPVSFIPMAAVGEQGEFYANEIKLLHEVYKGFTYFEEGDILFAKITPCMENGKGAIARGLKNNIGFGSTEFHVLRPNSECNNSFLYFITKLDLFRKAAEKEMTGSAGQKRVPKSFLQKWTLILPPISLQNQFAKKIEAIEQQKALINQSISDTQLLFDYTMDKYFN